MVRKLWGKTQDAKVAEAVEDKISEVSAEMQMQLAMMTRNEAMLREIMSEIEVIKNTLKDVTSGVGELKHVRHVGKKTEVLDGVKAEVKRIGHVEIKELIKRAANFQKAGYTRLYSRISDVTGVNIYAEGKMNITEEDGVEFTDNNKTYINTIFKKGVHEEAAAIALDIIRNG